MPTAEERRLADEADSLTRRILLELADAYEGEGRLFSAYPPEPPVPES